MKNLLAAALLTFVFSRECRAQSAEENFARVINEMTAQSRKTAASVARVFPKSVVCSNVPDKANAPKTLKLYPRLERFASLDELPGPGKPGVDLLKGGRVPADENAANLGGGGYFGVGTTRELFRYSSWSCDSWDYWITAKPAGLLRPTPTAPQAPVTIHLLVEVRGYVEFDGDLPCVAYY